MDDMSRFPEDVKSALAIDNPYYPYILFYIPSLNRFMDHNWKIVHDLSDVFDAWQIQRWKRNRRDDVVRTKNENIDMMIYYLNDEEDIEVLEYLGWNDSYGVKVDRDYYGPLETNVYG